MIRAAIYCRISRDKEGRALGVQRQRQDCLALVDRNGWSVVHDGESDTFTDNDISGARGFTERAALGRLMEAADSGQVDAIVAYSQARLFRDTGLFLEFCERLKVAGVEMLALVADADVNPGGSLFLATVIAAKDAEERRRVSELVRRKLLDNAEKGEAHGGPRPFGYQRDEETGKLEKDPVESALVQEAVAKLLEGASLYSIAKDWNDRGFRPVRGQRFYPPQVRAILRSARIAGLRVYRGDVIAIGDWDPIIDEATWLQICKILDDPSRRSPPASRKYPLKGLVWCGHCGKHLVPHAHHGVPQYACVKNQTGGCGGVVVKAENLEKYVFNLVLPILDAPGLRDAAFGHDLATAEEIRELVLANSGDEAKIKALAAQLEADDIEPADYVTAVKPIRAKIKVREEKLAMMQSTTALSRIGGQVRSHWNLMTPDDQRSILKSVIEKIIVNKASVRGARAFEPGRVQFKWVEWTLVSLRAFVEKTEEGRKAVVWTNDDDGTEIMSLSPLNDAQFLEDLPLSQYEGVDPETDLGITIPGA